MKDWREACLCARRFFMFASAIMAILAIIGEARATWKPKYASADPSVQAWFSAQHNAQGQWCCDKSDGHPYYGAYTLNPDGSVTIGSGKGAHKLPAYMVLKGPNPTGHAVWWHLGETDFCFAPGPLT